ncbi:MAG: amino acid permease [Vicinamibacterales bacterium]
MSSSPAPGGRRDLPRVLGVVQATALVIGTIIGTSIFVQPSEVTRLVPTASGILVAWALAGTLTMLFALTCAELASAFPATGGVYVFLREAYSRRLAFLWGWSSVWIIHTGVIAAIAMVCARYLAYFAPAATDHERIVAVGVVVAVSALNYAGVRIGAVVLTLSTAAKLLAIAVLLVAGLAAATPVAVPTWHPGLTELETVPLAQLLLGAGAGLFAFGGAHAVTYVAGETTDPVRTVPRALTIGTLVVTLCYIALNALYLYALPLDTVRTSPRVAAEVAAVLIGPVGGSAVASMVVLSGMGTITGIALAGPRLYLSMAADGMMPAWLDAVHPRFRTPHRAILLQAGWAIVLVASGQYATLFARVVYVEWFFFALLAAGLFVLRRRADYRPPARMWGFPLTPAIVVVASAAVVVSHLVAQPRDALIGAAMVAAGWPVGVWFERRRRQ